MAKSLQQQLRGNLRMAADKGLKGPLKIAAMWQPKVQKNL
jgi:hypothetical protein